MIGECTCKGYIDDRYRLFCRGCYETARAHAFIKGIVACARNAGHGDEDVKKIVRTLCGVEGISLEGVALPPSPEEAP